MLAADRPRRTSPGQPFVAPVGSDTWRRGRVVQARACKALYPGSIPGVASHALLWRVRETGSDLQRCGSARVHPFGQTCGKVPYLVTISALW